MDAGPNKQTKKSKEIYHLFLAKNMQRKQTNKNKQRNLPPFLKSQQNKTKQTSKQTNKTKGGEIGSHMESKYLLTRCTVPTSLTATYMQTDRLISRKGRKYKKLTTFSASGVAHMTCAPSHSAAAAAQRTSTRPCKKHYNAFHSTLSRGFALTQ
jgi:hypothetical protein